MNTKTFGDVTMKAVSDTGAVSAVIATIGVIDRDGDVMLDGLALIEVLLLGRLQLREELTRHLHHDSSLHRDHTGVLLHDFDLQHRLHGRLWSHTAIRRCRDLSDPGAKTQTCMRRVMWILHALRGYCF